MYRDSPEDSVDDFYQYVDHLIDPPFRFDWRARAETGLSFMKHSQGTRFSNFHGWHFDGVRDRRKISQT